MHICVAQHHAAMTKANTSMLLELSYAATEEALAWLEIEHNVAAMPALSRVQMRAKLLHGDLRTAMRLWRTAVIALQLELA